MPFSVEHKHYLEAMGMVPWIHRDAHGANVADVADVAAVSDHAVEPVLEGGIEKSSCVFGENQLLESCCRGVKARLHTTGQEPDDVPVLLVFDATLAQLASSNEASIDLEPSDERLLLDMLKAIELAPSSVARCLVNQTADTDQAATLQAHISAGTKAVLHLVTEADDITDDEEASSRIDAPNLSVPVWRLPHPVWIKRQPVLKRRAWNVLKAVKHSLGQPRL